MVNGSLREGVNTAVGKMIQEVPMRRRIPTATVAVARTAPTIHRMRLGSRSASSIRTPAAARRPAFPCEQDARNRNPDTRATRPWIVLCGRAGWAARAHRPGWARRALDARPSTPSPQIDASHTAGQPDVWTKPADDILARSARVALRTGTVHDRQQVMSRPTGTGH